MASMDGDSSSCQLHPPTAVAPAGGLPTHTTSSKTPPGEDETRRLLRRRRRRRCCCVCLIATLVALLLLGVTLLALFLTVLRVRDPSTRLVSARVIGFNPGGNLSPPSLNFNLTLLLTAAVHNPNAASFSYASGGAKLYYRGDLVGQAEVEPGRIPSRGDGALQMEMTVLSGSFAAHMAELISDLEAGAVPLDASARIPGKVSLLGGVLSLHAVAYSDCHVVFGFPEMQIRSQDCHDHTKL